MSSVLRPLKTSSYREFDYDDDNDDDDDAVQHADNYDDDDDECLSIAPNATLNLNPARDCVNAVTFAKFRIFAITASVRLSVI